MALKTGAGRGPGHVNRQPQGLGALGPDIVTGVTVLGDMDVPITSPSSMNVPMQTNGTTLLIETSGSAAHGDLDVSKITLSVQDRGHNTSGDQVFRTRTIVLRGKLYKPYGEDTTVYQPSLGDFYVKLGDYIFNEDAT